MRPNLSKKKCARTLRSERGESAISFIMMFVLVLLVAEIIVVGARVSGANAALANAAREGARQGSLVQTQSAAGGKVDSVARDNLARNGQTCGSVAVNDTSFIEHPDADGKKSVTATVSCWVDLSDLSFLGLPLPSTFLTHTHTEPLETYRATGTLGTP